MRSVMLGASTALGLWAGAALWAYTSVPCGQSQCCNPQTNCTGWRCGATGAHCNCCYCGIQSMTPYICCALSINPLINCTSCCLGTAPPGGGD
jgi:hypothetical protein